MFESLYNVARPRIGHTNPFPALEGFPSGMDACKWGLTDLYPEDEAILRTAITNKQVFDTRWAGCKKEIRSFRMISDGNVLTIMASAEMDDFDDLIYDAMDTEEELTEEQIEMLHDFWYDSPEVTTETESETTIELTTYDAAMEALAKLEDENEKHLNRCFEVVKEWVKYVLNMTKEEKPMKKSELIRTHRAVLIDTMVDRYHTVLECGGSVQYKIYLWSDGEIECQEGPQGDNGWLQARDAEPRDLYYVTTVAAPFFDPWDLADHAAPDDEDERETERREIIEWAVDDYRENGADAALDAAIEEAEQQEEEDEYYN